MAEAYIPRLLDPPKLVWAEVLDPRTLVGPSGRSADVLSVWIVRTGEELPRFVTAYPEVGR